MVTDGMVDRAEGGKFAKGHSVRGGRHAGPSASERIAAYIRPHEQAVLDKAIELAKMGDPRSMQIVLERLAPIVRQESEKVMVPGFAAAGTVQDKAEAVLQAVADGQISADAGQKMLAMIDVYNRTVTAADFEQRLQAIESGRTLVQPGTLIDSEAKPETEL